MIFNSLGFGAIEFGAFEFGAFEVDALEFNVLGFERFEIVPPDSLEFDEFDPPTLSGFDSLGPCSSKITVAPNGGGSSLSTPRLTRSAVIRLSCCGRIRD